MEKVIRVDKKVYLEAFLISLIPILSALLNRFLSITNPYLGIILTVSGQFIISTSIVGLITLLEGGIVKELFLITIIFNSIIFFLRLITFSLPYGIFLRIFSALLPITYIGIETVFLGSIPLVSNLQSIRPFYGILLIVFLKFLINYFVMVPILNTTVDIHIIIFLIFISQLIPMVLFAKLPFNMAKFDINQAILKSLNEFKTHLRASLTIGGIYSIIISVVSVFNFMEASEYLIPLLLNYISSLVFIYFFVWISEYER
ncbi:MAG: hypothetical protein K6343_06050 [Caldisericaceae bacterium]